MTHVLPVWGETLLRPCVLMVFPLILAADPVWNVIALTTKGIEWTVTPELVLIVLYCVFTSARAYSTIGTRSAYAITVTKAEEMRLAKRVHVVSELNVLNDTVMFESGGNEPVTSSAAAFMKVFRLTSTTNGILAPATPEVGPVICIMLCVEIVPPMNRRSTTPAVGSEGKFTPESVSLELGLSVHDVAICVEMAEGATSSVPIDEDVQKALATVVSPKV